MFKGPEEVAYLLEVRARSMDLVKEAFDGDDDVFSEGEAMPFKLLRDRACR